LRLVEETVSLGLLKQMLAVVVAVVPQTLVLAGLLVLRLVEALVVAVIVLQAQVQATGLD
jgi:hypothetical protein